MSPEPYRRLRSLVSPLHPQKIWSRLRYVAHRLGWHHLRLWVSGLHPRRLAASYRFLVAKRAEARRRRSEPRLTVAVDISPFWEPLTGIGWYLYRLLQGLAERDDVRLRLYGPGLVDKGDTPDPVVAIPEGAALERVRHCIPKDFSLVWYWLTDRLRAHEERLIAFDRNQILFAPNYFLPTRFGRCEGHLVATIHDLSVLVVPETMRESTRRDLSEQLRATAEQAALVLTDSEAVKAEIVAEGLAPEHRVRAVHLAPGSTQGVQKQTLTGLPSRYVLFVGTVEPRKNLETLLAAFERHHRAFEGGRRLSLVLCGALGWKTDGIQERIQKAEAAGWCRRLGYLTEPELAGVYSLAEWVALPSLYEGFGLPAVEAMAAGVPLLLSDIPVLREIGGDSALYAPSGDVEAWWKLIDQVSQNPQLRAHFAEASRRRSHSFSWRKTADATVQAWRAAAEMAGDEVHQLERGSTGDKRSGPGEIQTRGPKHRRLVVAGVLFLAAIGHAFFWYGPRARPSLPEDGLPARLLDHPDLPLAVWMPFPHQNLNTLGDFGLDPKALEAALRLAELPTPSLPRFGSWAVPPSSSLAVATDREGERFVVAAQVYPTVAAFSRLAGRLANNPWLEGGDVVSEEQRLVVGWHGNVWTVSSTGDVSFGEGGTFPAPSEGKDPGPASSPGRKALLVAEARQTRAPLPEGRYYLFTDSQGIELVSEGARERPPDRAQIMNQTRTILLAISGIDGPLGQGGQALALMGQDTTEIAELPRGAVLFRPGVDRWDLPAEGLLDMAGRKLEAGTAAGMSLVAADTAGVTTAEALAPSVSSLLGSTSSQDRLTFGLWVELAPAAAEVNRIRRGLERAPLWSRDQRVRWKEGDQFLAGLAVPWQRMVLTVQEDPPALWLRIEAGASD